MKIDVDWSYVPTSLKDEPSVAPGGEERMTVGNHLPGEMEDKIEQSRPDALKTYTLALRHLRSTGRAVKVVHTSEMEHLLTELGQERVRVLERIRTRA